MVRFENNDYTHIDLSYLESFGEVANQMKRELIGNFLSNYDSIITDLMEHVNFDQWENVGQITNKLKLDIDLFRISDCSELVRKIEYDSLNQQNLDLIEANVHVLVAKLEKAIFELNMEFNILMKVA